MMLYEVESQVTDFFFFFLPSLQALNFVLAGTERARVI